MSSRVRQPTECLYCGAPFTPYRPNQKFCPGGKCRMEYHAAQFRLHRQDRDRPVVSEAAAILGRLGGYATARKRRRERIDTPEPEKHDTGPLEGDY